MAVKKNFQDEQGEWQAYWNGKKYAGDKVYITVSGIGNKREFKCSFSPAEGVSFGGAYGSIDRAKSALRSLDIIQ
jgi:hypothetical protein